MQPCCGEFIYLQRFGETNKISHSVVVSLEYLLFLSATSFSLSMSVLIFALPKRKRGQILLLLMEFRGGKFEKVEGEMYDLTIQRDTGTLLRVINGAESWSEGSIPVSGTLYNPEGRESDDSLPRSMISNYCICSMAGFAMVQSAKFRAL